MALNQIQSYVHVFESLPFIQHSLHNHTQVVAQLALIIRQCSHFAPYHLNIMGQYLRSNLENNKSIISSLQCLVILHPQLSSYFKRNITSLLLTKYQCTNFTQQIEKVKAVNTELVEPFIYLIGRLAKWYELEIQDRQYKDIDISQPIFLLEYAYTVSRIEFISDQTLQGGEIDYCIITLYHLLTEDQNVLTNFLKNKNLYRQLTLTIFYFIGNYSMQNPEHVYIIYHSVAKLLYVLFFQNIPLKKIILEQLLIQMRQKGLESYSRQQSIIMSIQCAITAILAMKWSEQAQKQWLSFSWIFWDLLGVTKQKRVQLASDLLYNAKQLMKCLQLF